MCVSLWCTVKAHLLLGHVKHEEEVLTNHVSLLMDHHSQVFKDFVDICDVRLTAEKHTFHSVQQTPELLQLNENTL